MKYILLIPFFMALQSVFGQSNNLELEIVIHRSNVGEFYPNGLEYYQMPQDQLRPVECSAIVKNIGENDITNCFLQVDFESEGTVIQTIFSDSIFIASGSQDSLYLNAHFEMAEPIGNYLFRYYIISDSLELDYSDNMDSVNFEITEHTLSRSDFLISDSTKGYYHDSLDIRSFGYVFKMETDACLSAVYPWVTHDFYNAIRIDPTHASLFVLDSINNEYDPIGLTESYIPTVDELGGRYKIDFGPLHNELTAGNTYLITINDPNQLRDFYLCQETIDSTAYHAFTDGSPGDSYIQNSPFVNTRIIKMDIEFGTSIYCNLNDSESELELINVYPNPTKNYLNIDYDLDLTVEIINSLGAVVLVSNANKISISHLSSGIYTVKIYDDQRSVISVNKVMKIE